MGRIEASSPISYFQSSTSPFFFLLKPRSSVSPPDRAIPLPPFTISLACALSCRRPTTMALFACVSTILSFICPPLTEALQEYLRTAAQRCFSFLTGWATREIRSRRDAVEEVPVVSTWTVGLEEKMSEIQNYLRDDGVRIVGIYGMGGIGKTTLLKKINNDFFQSGTQGMFDVVIWVSVSKEIDIPNIQRQVADRVGMPSSDGVRDSDLFKALSKKRFLLLLDDVWAKLDLVKIGIPTPSSRKNCKIAFTTRSSDVCSDMDVDRTVRVDPLDETRSWELFCSKISSEAVFNNPTVGRLAKQVVQRCGGLPLSLVTVGRAMANRTLPNEWRRAVKDLDRSAEKLRGMDEVLSCLKFSYDNLEDDKMRSALLFCAMYPRSTDISRQQLIEYWVGEGLIDSGIDDVDDHVDDARDRGHVLISNLQASCLLEAGMGNQMPTVKMHDAVRDMALWLNNVLPDEVDGRFLVLDEENVTQVTRMQKKERVRRVWMCNLDRVPSSSVCIPECPNTWTLLGRSTTLGPSIPQNLFDFMTTLRVLDLSWSKLEELPIEIGLLVELRYLNLSFTVIKALPIELGKLVSLRHLVLEFTYCLRRIPREAIVGLSSLQVLNMWYSNYDWQTQAETRAMEMGEKSQQHSNLDVDATEGGAGRQLELSDLEGIRQLHELYVELRTPHELERVLRSDMLSKCARYVSLGYFEPVDNQHDDLSLTEGGALFRRTFHLLGEHLRELDIQNGFFHLPMVELHFNLDEVPCLEQLTIHGFENELTVVIVGTTNSTCRGSNDGVAPSSVQSLRWLCIEHSPGLKKLKFVGRFENLEVIDMSYCVRMEELVLDDDDEDGVRELGRGGRQEGLVDSHFPSLKIVRVVGCPQLRQLPFDRGSTPNLEMIVGDDES